MTAWPQHEVVTNERGRILVMDSLGYVDERVDVRDVVVGGSHGAPCATQLVLDARPRGLICHDAGIGLGDGGVAGLKLLDDYLIPGAAVSGMSARISDGLDMYRNGTISRFNRAAARLGVETGMPTSEAASLMLNGRPPFRQPERRQVLVHESELGRVFALDTVKYADARIEGSVLCMGSHSARSMPKYLDDVGVALAGVITNDVGRAKDDSGIAGLWTLDEVKIPAAVVSCDTARVGDAQSTYHAGVVSACNDTAAKLGVVVGQRATEAAAKMLAARRR
jgi:hypothetical protein